jgi:hypothetical protein
VIIEIIRSTKANNHSASLYQRISKKIGVVRTSLMFVSFYLLMWISIDLLLFQAAFDSQNFVIDAIAWTKCTFITFDKNNPEAWRDICGNLPKNVIPFDYIMWLNVTICCQSILIAGVYIIAIYSALYEYIWPDSDNLINKGSDPKALVMLGSKSIDIGSDSQGKNMMMMMMMMVMIMMIMIMIVMVMMMMIVMVMIVMMIMVMMMMIMMMMMVITHQYM